MTTRAVSPRLAQLLNLFRQLGSRLSILDPRRTPKVIVLSLFNAAALLYFVPWRPSFPYTGEGAYGFVLSFATEHRLTYGREIIFNFGPLARYLMSTYHGPDQFLVMLVLNALIYGFFAVLISRLLFDLPVHHILILCTGFFYALNLTWDIAFFAFPLLFALAVTGMIGHWHPWLPLLILPACAVATLYKGTYAFLSLILIVGGDLYLTFVRRQIKLYSLLYLLLCILILAVLGQPSTGLPLLLRGYYLISSAYSEAMQSPGPTIEIYAFLASQALLYTCLLISSRNTRPLERAYLLSSFAVVSFFVWKSAFVRHDVHATQAYAGALFLACLSTTLLAKVPAGDGAAGTTRWYRLSLGSVITIILLAGIGIARIHDRLDHRDLAGTFIQRPGERLLGFLEFCTQQTASQLSRTLEASLAQIRKDHPLPKLDGTIDVIPSDQSVLLAHHVQYKPRPVFQNYQANSAALVSKNTQFFESDGAPEYVLFYFPTDYRFGHIWINEAATWPTLLAKYDLVDFSEPYFVLKKRRTRRASALRVIERREVAFGHHIQLPKLSGITFATITLKRTMLGHADTALYKIPLPILTMHLVDGSSQSSEMITDLASAPFVVSTFMDSGANLAGLFLGFQQPDVEALEINLPSGPARLWYEAHATVEFSSLELQALSQSEQMASDSLDSVKHLLELGKNADLSDGRQRLMVLESQPDLTKLHVVASPPSRTWLHPAADHLKTSFGILDQAWQQATDTTVTFKVSAVMTDGSLQPLWSRTLNPGRVGADRAPQTVELALPTGTLARLQFETLADGRLPASSAYWTDVSLRRRPWFSVLSGSRHCGPPLFCRAGLDHPLRTAGIARQKSIKLQRLEGCVGERARQLQATELQQWRTTLCGIANHQVWRLPGICDRIRP